MEIAQTIYATEVVYQRKQRLRWRQTKSKNVLIMENMAVWHQISTHFARKELLINMQVHVYCVYANLFKFSSFKLMKLNKENVDL